MMCSLSYLFGMYSFSELVGAGILEEEKRVQFPNVPLKVIRICNCFVVVVVLFVI